MSLILIILLVILIGFALIVFKLRGLIKKLFFFSTAKWENTPKDKVILHCIARGKCIPNPSPFVLKVETYLRMANIPYEIDEEDSFYGPTGKTPWMTINGKHISDSQLIIEYLNKKFDKDVSAKFTKEQRAYSRAIRVMLEEHAFWGLVHYRWIGGIAQASKIMKIPGNIIPIIGFIMKKRITKGLWAQGLGRLPYETMVQMVCEDLRTLSTLLGTKKFISGDEPCEDDCSIFGMLAEIVWAAFESPYEKLLNEELPNLKEYCYRMKEKYWADWDDLISNKKK